jgi:hypothetical protein
MPRLSADERGLSQSVQYAVILPALMLVTLGIIQAGVWIHGHNVAIRAANAGADIARGSYGTAAEARAAAMTLAETGGLRDVQIDVERATDGVTVSVSAGAPLIFDVGLGRIRERARAPVERATPP